MSSSINLAYSKPLNQPRRSPVGNSRPELQVVPVFKRKTVTLPMWILIAGMLLLALVIPVFINTQMAMTSYQMHSQEQELSQLMDYQASLITKAREAQSPQYLAEKAAEIGLVPAGNSGYIRVETGEIIPGKPAK